MPTEPRPVVVDASVVLKWQLDDEEYLAQADALLHDFHAKGATAAIAPHLLTFEVVNGMVSATRQKRIAPSLAAEALANLLALGIEQKEVSALRVLEVSLQHNLSAYDAAYLALAEAEGCDLWTGDRPFYQAVRDAAPLVRWLGDYPVVA